MREEWIKNEEFMTGYDDGVREDGPEYDRTDLEQLNKNYAAGYNAGMRDRQEE